MFLNVNKKIRICKNCFKIIINTNKSCIAKDIKEIFKKFNLENTFQKENYGVNFQIKGLR